MLMCDVVFATCNIYIGAHDLSFSSFFLSLSFSFFWPVAPVSFVRSFTHLLFTMIVCTDFGQCVYKKVNIICHGRVTQNVVDTFVLRRQFWNDIHPEAKHTGCSFIFWNVCSVCAITCERAVRWFSSYENRRTVPLYLFHSNIILNPLHGVYWKIAFAMENGNNINTRTANVLCSLSLISYVSMLLLLLVFHFAWGFLCVLRTLCRCRRRRCRCCCCCFGPFSLTVCSTRWFELNRTHHPHSLLSI